MLVVIPICHKDWTLAENNLQWASELDGKVEYHALITHDESLPVEGLERVKRIADGYFQHVSIFNYPVPPTDEWPEAPNFVWQAVAWEIFNHVKKGDPETHRPWFWWEADATPLKRGWLDLLWKEYQKGGRPFAGHVVRGPEHMNGVAIYPANVPEYVSDCLVTRIAPWDVTLSNECPTKHIYVMNRLIGHWPRANGWTQQLRGDALKHVNGNGMAIWHGVNDGSLIGSMRGEPEVKATSPLVAVIEDESIFADEFNIAEGNYQKEAVNLIKKGYAMPVRGSHVPSITEQTPFEVQFCSPKPKWDRVYFNPGIVKDDAGKEYLVTRRWDRCTPKSWHSTLEVFTESWSKELIFPGQNYLYENEDPRVVFHDGKFYVAHCQWIAESFYQAKQLLSVFDKDWNFVHSLQPIYGFNGFADYPQLGHQEKNWVWFHDGDYWNFVYSFAPHVVARCLPQDGIAGVPPIANFETQSPTHLWAYGEIRGGTPPVRVGDEYVTFFHSSLPWSGKQKQYFMGAYAFNSEPPFNVTRITPQPILSGSEDDSRTLGGPLVVFPGGALFEDGIWKVVFGINDENAGYIKIPHDKLEGLMVKA